MVERQRVLPDVSRQDLLDFAHNTLTKGCFVEGLVQGNILQEVRDSVATVIFLKLMKNRAQLCYSMATNTPCSVWQERQLKLKRVTNKFANGYRIHEMMIY